jgi:hypothetical protein
LNLQRGKRFFAAATVLLSLVPQALPCTFAFGYFYQVTALKGRVIGANRHGSISSLFGWLISTAPIAHAHLALYEYRWPIHSQSEAPFVKAVETDSSGDFDFGILKTGHYTLVIDGQRVGDDQWTPHDRYDVEVKDQPRPTVSVTIDVSPVFPDCSGGHEFIVKSR